MPDQEARSAATVEPRLPDDMGIHSDDGTIWLAAAHYPKRHDARRWYMDFAGAHFLDVSVTVAWMRYEPLDGEDYWVGCQADAPGAFKVWQLEDA